MIKKFIICFVAIMSIIALCLSANASNFVNHSFDGMGDGIELGAMPTHGNVKVPVIRISVKGASNYEYALSKSDLTKRMFGGTNVKFSDPVVNYTGNIGDNTDNVRRYLYDSSYGKLNITGIVFDYTTKKTSYNQDTALYDIFSEIKEAINSKQNDFASFDWANYDADGNGYVDCVYLYFCQASVISNLGAGSSGECCAEFESTDAGTKKIGYMILLNPYNPFVVTASHETMHALGMVDIYNTCGKNVKGTEYYTIMDFKSILNVYPSHGFGDIPSFFKYNYGWTNNIFANQTTSQTKTYEINSYTNTGDVLIVPAYGNPNSNSMIMIEYLSKGKNNDFTGVRIWKINSALNPQDYIASDYIFEYIESADQNNDNRLFKTGDTLTKNSAVNTKMVTSVDRSSGKVVPTLEYVGIDEIKIVSTTSNKATISVKTSNTACEHKYDDTDVAVLDRIYGGNPYSEIPTLTQYRCTKCRHTYEKVVKDSKKLIYVDFSLDGGTIDGSTYSKTVEIYDGQPIPITFNDPVKKGYRFAGWRLTTSNQTSQLNKNYTYQKSIFSGNLSVIIDGVLEDVTDVRRDIHFVPVWELKQENYKIYYKWRDGSIISISELTGYTSNTTDISLPKIPACSGYVVTNQGTNSWYISSTGSATTNKIYKDEMGDKTFYADRQMVNYSLVYYYVDSEGSLIQDKTLSPKSYNISSSFTLPSPKLPSWSSGFVDGKWHTDKNCTSAPVAAIQRGSTQYSAFYTKINSRYTIDYKWSDGTPIDFCSSETYCYGQSISLPALKTLTGYTVSAWYLDASCTNKITTISPPMYGNLTIYAKKTPCVYTITYKWANGKEIAGCTPKTYTYGKATSFSALPSVFGYNVFGWYTSSDCKTKASAPTATTSGNITVYAQKELKLVTTIKSWFKR